jgi:hypothetical protein
MPYEEASNRERTAFAELVEAVAERQRINVPIAIYSEHWEAYDRAVNRLAAATQAYGIASTDLSAARSEHDR